MIVVNDQAGTPAVRGVGLGKFAGGLEPGIETEPIAAGFLRNQNARKAGLEHVVRQLSRYAPSLFCRRGALGKTRRHRADAIHDLLLGRACGRGG